MDAEVSWLEHLTDKQWAEIRKIAGSLFDAGYFSGNQLKIGIMAFMIWVTELDAEAETHFEPPNSKMH